ncbi:MULTISPECIES: MarC family protein [unclassified Ruegeria]|uniref:MarC family protein n=1 Tax=unclassified Ruegeria TaxID=2625375 RepID=UPI001490FFC4|nr:MULTISPECIES: MarC family protein [unclassified Ruegeria]NOC44732.1 NAAT family transporter [Ruegeria sp. HKCCD7559]NOD83458.1 NAAT family transporter [Ruegeria sp. HKCCD6119]
MENLLEHFVTLWVVIDPIGTIPVFIAVTAGLEAAARRKTALLASLISAGVLLFFLVFGQLLIEALDIGLNSFQVAGGIILFLFALTMIFGESKQDIEQRQAEEDQEDKYHKQNPAIFPLAVPSLASPGAMLAVVILTDNHRYSAADQGITALVMLSVLVVAFVLMLLAEPIIRLIGHSGAAIISRIMGMILASVAVNSVLSALLEIFKTGQL